MAVVELMPMFATVIGFPLVCLGFLLWMSHLEDTLPVSVRRAERTPDPAPILAIAVGAADLTGPAEHAELAVEEEAVHLPVQRSSPPLASVADDVLGPAIESLADPAPGVG